MVETRSRAGRGGGAVGLRDGGAGVKGGPLGVLLGGDGRVMWAGGLAVRLVLIVYAVWHDANFAVKYTDIDYIVFTDAARFSHSNLSPYDRDTYRYSPLLAWLLLPNITLHPAFGKLLFALADLFIASQLLNMLSMGTKATPPLPPWKARLAACCFLFNPIAINVSTRGNAEPLVSALVVGSLFALEQGRMVRAGVLLGLSVHLKIYPIIFSLPLFLSVPLASPKSRSAGRGGQTSSVGSRVIAELCDARRWLFAASAAVSCIGVTLVCYWVCGWRFLEEAYLYHITRTDHRHNLSLYFYPLYLSADTAAAKAISLLAFVPQIVLLVVLSIKYASRHIALCICCQTIAFVALNKVSTVQYFVWYFALLPIAVARGESWSLRWVSACAASWVLGLASWLGTAYHLEFRGWPVWLTLQCASGVLFFAHMLLIVALLRHAKVYE